MKKRKRTNGCLLSAIKTITIGAFALLMSFYGLFVLTSEKKEEALIQTLSATLEKESIQLAEPSVEEESLQDMEEDTPLGEAIQIDDSSTHTEQSVQGDAVERTQVNVYGAEALALEEPSEVPVEVQTIEVAEGADTTDTTDTTDIPVYNRYKLHISDYVIQEAEEIIAEEEVSVAKLVSRYFSNMTAREKMSIINMMASKIKNVDVGYLLGLITRGITDEDIAIIQTMIEENFSVEEVDELYSYYVRSDLAQLTP